MALDSVQGAFFADPAALSGLKREAAAQSPEAIRETAKQFESLFTTMMLKSMRSASMGEDMFGSSQTEFYQEMFDQQLAVQLSKGRGLGLADMLVRQLMTTSTTEAGAAETAATANSQGAAAAASPAKAVTGKSAGAFACKEDFIAAIRPACTAAAKELGVDPDTVIAHAALETGWGRHLPTGSDGRPSFNLFGIKAGSSWKGEVTTAATQEFLGGSMQQVDAGFRAYASPEQSIRDYVGLLKGNPRYAAALGTGGDVAAFARGLTAGGYATDPDYVSKLSAVAARLKGEAGMPIHNTNAI